MPPLLGAAPDLLLAKAMTLINTAQLPILFLGEEASTPENTAAIRALLTAYPLATVSTYQAAGVISRALQDCFVGRVGLFKNQPGDALLDQADVVMTVGYNSAGYDPEIWNNKMNKKIIHIDYNPAPIHKTYQPNIELIGSIHATLTQLTEKLSLQKKPNHKKEIAFFHENYDQHINSEKKYHGARIHPLQFIHALRKLINDETVVLCDIGSIYMWMSRYFLCYEPHHFLVSNGQQTLGVALPWAIGAHFACPNKKIVSLSGDGGFLFSATELETAVREKINFVHFIWTDGEYNMVAEQEVMKYHRKSGISLGKIDIINFAQAFGAIGFSVNSSEDLLTTMENAFASKGPVLVNIPIDYQENAPLFEQAISDVGG